jgi:hypothetical protein
MTPYANPYGQPMPAPPAAQPKKPSVHFAVQAIIGFFGFYAYSFILMFVEIVLIQIFPMGGEAVSVAGFLAMAVWFFIGMGGTLFLMIRYRWFGFLAGVLFAIIFPLLLFGLCLVVVFGSIGK